MNQEASTTPKRPRVITVAASILLGLFLFYLLGKVTGFELDTLVELLGKLHPGYLVLVVISTFLHFVLNAMKWHTVNVAVTTDQPKLSLLVRYSSLVSVLAQILPSHVCTVIVRSIALRWHVGLSIGKGASTALYDQLFDVLIPLILFVPSLLLLVGWSSSQTFILATLALLVLMPLLLPPFWGRLFTLLFRGLSNIPVIGPRLERRLEDMLGRGPEAASESGAQSPQDGQVAESTARQEIVPEATTSSASSPPPESRADPSRRSEALTSSPLFGKTTVSRLTLLACLRHVNLTLRLYWIVLAAGLPIPFAHILATLPVLIMSVVVVALPGGLGVLEWGIAGTLVTLGNNHADAVNLAFLNRILTICAVTLVSFTLLAPLVWQRLPRRRPEKPDGDR